MDLWSGLVDDVVSVSAVVALKMKTEVRAVKHG